MTSCPYQMDSQKSWWSSTGWPNRLCSSLPTSQSMLSQLCYGPVVTYCMVYHYTKRATLARLLTNKGPAIYVVHLNRYFVIPPWLSGTCGAGAERPGMERSYSRMEGSWQQNGRTTLASARALCLDLLSHVWLRISGGLNCCQESRRGVV